MYIKKTSQEDFALKLKLRPAKFFVTPPIFAGNSRFTGISQLRAVKTAPQPLIVNSAFFTLYVGIILPIGPIPISLFVFDLEAED